MDYLPLVVDVRDRLIVVVGGGSIAARQVELLLRASARVRIVSPTLDAELSGEDTLQGRASFEPRTELEAILRAPDDDGIARACNLILESFDPPAAALQPAKVRRDPTAGGWS